MSRSPYQRYSWQSDIFETANNDIERFMALLNEECQRLNLQQRVLGKVEGQPIMMLQSPNASAGLPSILISAGFHGEEAAGPWGMLHFLSSVSPELFERVNLTLLPLNNPTGFIKGHRFNIFGENPNRGYLAGVDDAKPTVEGKILLEHGQLIQAASKDGILTCHEDVLQTRTYLYSFEPRQQPGKFSQQLLGALSEYFDVAQDDDIDGCPVENGFIFNHFDSSFEAWLVRSGAKVGACSETPATQNFDRRILANSAVMQRFVDYIQAQ
ncbi:M14 family metallocarboxypeptidase [Shewanella avicenniae]|uniref:M14 family metallocarboxypeptidase n=1 Tax=Shewanella avicenniae TaxID=2814294 RepID=A0ABX7QPP5_9GAMM|nr:M14 family metallocarboxypeptidase [Shewanella avicenniae]QSX32992.1 M14 family metallocarboxypeptidase [Shewanella avicenniae]